jgi:hypothetical protein
MKLTLALITSFLMVSTTAMPLEGRDNHVEAYQDPRGDVAKLFIRQGDKPNKPLQHGPAFGTDGTCLTTLAPYLRLTSHSLEGALPSHRQGPGHIHHPRLLARASQRAQEDLCIPVWYPVDDRRRIGKLQLSRRLEPWWRADLQFPKWVQQGDGFL